jgi:hypothetical protein
MELRSASLPCRESAIIHMGEDPMFDLFFFVLNTFSGIRPPEPLGGAESREVVERLYTQEMKQAGLRGSVRVVLSIDAQGQVTEARATRLPKWAGESEVILIDGATGKRMPSPPPYTEDLRLWRIAEEAARAERFRPAMRGKRPVRYRGYVCSYMFDA